MGANARPDVNVMIGADTASLRAGMAEAKALSANATNAMTTGLNKVGVAANRSSFGIRNSGKAAKWASLQFKALLRAILPAAAAVMAFRSVTGAVRIADDMSLLTSRLISVTGSAKEAKKAKDELFASSQRLQVSYTSLVKTMARMTPSIREMNGGTEIAVGLAEVIAATAKISGTSAEEATAAATQFAQALGSGKLAGDELKSILENNQELARQLAAGLGVASGQLKGMGAAGELTADRVAKALLGRYNEIQAKASEIAMTVGGSWGAVNGSVARLLDRMNSATGATSVLARALRGIGMIVDRIADSFGEVKEEAKGVVKDSGLLKFGDILAATYAKLADIVFGLVNGIRLLVDASWVAATAIGSLLATSKKPSDIFSDAADSFKSILADAKETWALMTGGKGSFYSSVNTENGKAPRKNFDTDSLTANGSKKATANEISKRLAAALRLNESLLRLRTDRLKSTLKLDEIEADRQLALGEITQTQRLALQKAFEFRRTAIAVNAHNERLKFQAIADSPEKRAEVYAQIQAEELAHQQKMAQIRANMQVELAKSPGQDSFLSQFQSGFQQMLTSIAAGTMKFKDIWSNAMRGLLGIGANVVSEMASKWLTGEVKKTFFTKAQTGVRKTIEIGAASQSVATNAGAASANVGNSAVEAMAAAYKAIAGIPYVGPVLAPIAAGVAFAAVAGLAGKLVSARGGYDIPAGINPVVQTHAREMILPATHADTIRSLGENGGGGGGGSVTINALDSKSVKRMFNENGDAMLETVMAMMRKGGMTPRGA